MSSKDAFMPYELSRFVWPVSKKGYSWLNAENGDVYLRDWGYYSDHTHYLPLEVSGLYRAFAETHMTYVGVWSFVQRYGLLGGFAHHMAYDEPFKIWLREILRMRQAVLLWDAATARDMATLKRYIKWDGANAVWYRHPVSRIPKFARDMPELFETLISRKGSETYWEDPFQSLTPGDLIKPALFYVQNEVNASLERTVVPSLLWDPNHLAMKLRLSPGTLLGCLWLQFADSIDNNTLYRECLHCGTPFAVGPGTARMTKLFCSNACRSKNYRERQAKAQRLHAEGRALGDIARELDTDVDTVRAWIEKGQ
jgi:hypothetical protein